MKKRGFTLIELLVVIAIIAILAGIVIIAVNPARQVAQARNAQRRADVLTDLNAIHQYFIDTGNFPTGIDDKYRLLGTDTSGCNITCGTWTTETTCLDLGSKTTPILVPTYISGIPKDAQGTDAQTGYAITKDANNRITVRACKTEIPPASAIIEVTR